MKNLLKAAARRLCQRRTGGSVNASALGAAAVEQLEERRLMAASPHVVTSVSDNRGWTVLTFDIAINKTTFSGGTTVFTAGTDGKFGTADDRKVAGVGLFYNDAQKKLTVKAPMAADKSYRLRLLGTKIKSMAGGLLDGEFRAGKTSGNGVAGGNYDIQANAVPAPANVTVRMTTSEGTMNITLYRSLTNIGKTVANFLKYANAGLWDTTFFHRKAIKAEENIDVVQGGGFKINSDNSLGEVTKFPAIPLEAFYSNSAGTLAMARGNSADSGTNQWFFNVNDDLNLNPTAAGTGYTVFGLISTSSKPILNAIFAKSTVNASGDTHITDTDISSAVAKLPDRRPADYAAHGNHIDPNRDLEKITRVAIVMTTKGV